MKKVRKNYKKLYEKDERYIKKFHEYIAITKQFTPFAYFLLLKLKKDKKI